MTQPLSRRRFLGAAIAGSTTLAASALHAAPAGLYTPGTYSAKASGIGDVVVTMTFDEHRITDVVLDVSHETPTVGQAAAGELKSLLLTKQTADIQAVSGASITSRAVHQAAAKCIAQAKGQIPVEVITAKESETEDDADWLGTPPEIDEKDIVATHTTDILVIGCGTGGMFAVASAAEAGGKVIGIDRFPVGTGIREDLGAIDSRYQKAYGTKIDKFDFITMATLYAGGRIQQNLVKLWCEKSGETIDWLGDRLEERGIALWHESGDPGDETRYKHYAIGHSPRLPVDKNGRVTLDLNTVLYDYAIKKGARFNYSMKMVKLEKAGDRVTGCIAQNADGKYVRYIALKGTVVATGGYAQNFKMIEALQPWNLGVTGRSGALPGARGDGIRACLWVGAKMDETHSMLKFDRCAIRPDQNPGKETIQSGDNGFFWMGSQPWLKVNADGERFMNESGTYENILHADEYQKGHAHYTLFDSNWVKYAEQFKMHGCSRMFPFANGADPNIPWKVVKEKMLPRLIAKGFVQQADTIEELAKKLGLPVKTLKATVARNNELFAMGEDVDYGKEKHRLSPLDKPPFYGAKNTGWMLCTLDGIQINNKMNAIDTKGRPIPGLFVIGNDSGGYFANEYPNLATGMACGRTVTFGRLVGQYLAKL